MKYILIIIIAGIAGAVLFGVMSQENVSTLPYQQEEAMQQEHAEEVSADLIESESSFSGFSQGQESEAYCQTSPSQLLPQDVLAVWNSKTQEDWRNFLVEENDLIYLDESFGASPQIIDITGNGIPEAIISANSGNASASFIVTMKEDGTYSLAQTQDVDGSTNPTQLISFGRVRFAESFEFLQDQCGYWTSSREFVDEMDTFVCSPNTAKAFTWNDAGKQFVYSESLTAEHMPAMCPQG